LLYLVAAVLVALNWLRLESPRSPGTEWMLIVLLASLPALVGAWRWRVALAAVGAILAVRSAFGLSLLDARLWDADRDFLGPALSRFRTGLLAFYDVSLPFDGPRHGNMHGVVLMAIFGFCLVIALGIAARRPVVASLGLVAGAAWPATLLPGESPLLRGAFILAGALVLMAGLSTRDGRVLARGLVAIGAVCLAALAASTSPAVAKEAFLGWKDWDFYTKPARPVTVGYVWNSSYDGIEFPKKRTVVFEVSAPPRSLYWRATTLDAFDGRGWVEDQDRLFPAGQSVDVSDALLPRSALDRRRWLAHEVEIRALRDSHLIAASVPVAYEVEPEVGPVMVGTGAVALALNGLERGARYRAWSYAPAATPEQLGRLQLPYPEEIELGGYLNVLPGLGVPAFGTPEREEAMERLLEAYPVFDSRIGAYRRLYRQALEIVGRAQTPYAATVAIEAWLRSAGGFDYDEQPPSSGRTPPLVHFVFQSKRGYCQHYAGAMALMLRWLGIPARVAAGFTSGRYDSRRRTWTVTDHEAHTWVEVWFRGFGWLPFDPTPARGLLSAPYTSASQTFRPRGDLFAELGDIGRTAVQSSPSATAREALEGTGGPVGRDVPGDIGGLVTRERGESLLRFLALLGLVLAAAIVAAKTLLRAGRFLTRDPRRVAAACRRELTDFLVDQGIRVPPSATLRELGELVAAELSVDTGRFAAAVAAAGYGPPREARRAAVVARRELRTLERAIQNRLSPAERARGLFSLRSLGFTSS
jgi:transglutaminase-like putative cysteine protease